MLRLNDLKETRARKLDDLQAIVQTAEAAARDLDQAEEQRFEALKGEIAGLDAKINRAETLADLERAAPARAANGGDQFEEQCRSFSLVRAIASQVPGSNVDAGREREVSRELERRSGRTAEGMLVPTSVFEKRIVTTVSPAGGPGSNIVATTWRGQDFVDILRTSMAVRRLGARVLSGLTGNVDIPRLKASSVAYWVAENAPITPSDPQFDKVSLSPKHCGVLTEISRNMVQQTSPDIEDILRADFASLLASALDAAAIQGGGTNQPTGVLATSGVTDVPGGTNGLALSYANVVSLIGAVAGANALSGSLGFLTNSKVLAKASTTLKTATDTSSSFITEAPGAGSLAGYPLEVSNNVPSNIAKGSGTNLSALIFGNWADLLIGYWSAFDLLVNPYEATAYAKGNVLVRGMLTADIKVRHPESFAKIADVITT